MIKKYLCNHRVSFFDVSEEAKLLNRVLLLDFDETIALSDKQPGGDYVIQPDGSIKAVVMDNIKLKYILDTAINQNVPIHIVTARADIPNNRRMIEEVINGVNGFHAGIGGFKKHYIHFTSIMENGKRKTICTKAEIIKDIHRTYYSKLPRTAFLFVDDMTEYLEDVSQAGYLTLKANPETKTHFELAVNFIENGHPVLKMQSIRSNL